MASVLRPLVGCNVPMREPRTTAVHRLSHPRSNYLITTSTAAVDRRSTPSARADRQDPLPMFRHPDRRVFP